MAKDKKKSKSRMKNKKSIKVESIQIPDPPQENAGAKTLQIPESQALISINGSSFERFVQNEMDQNAGVRLITSMPSFGSDTMNFIVNEGSFVQTQDGSILVLSSDDKIDQGSSTIHGNQNDGESEQAKLLEAFQERALRDLRQAQGQGDLQHHSENQRDVSTQSATMNIVQQSAPSPEEGIPQVTVPVSSLPSTITSSQISTSNRQYSSAVKFVSAGGLPSASLTPTMPDNPVRLPNRSRPPTVISKLSSVPIVCTTITSRRSAPSTTTTASTTPQQQSTLPELITAPSQTISNSSVQSSKRTPLNKNSNNTQESSDDSTFEDNGLGESDHEPAIPNQGNVNDQQIQENNRSALDQPPVNRSGRNMPVPPEMERSNFRQNVHDGHQAVPRHDPGICCAHCSHVLDVISRQIVEILQHVRQNQRDHVVENELNLLPVLPFDDRNGLVQFSETLGQNGAVREQFSSLIRRLGGTDYKEAVNIAMEQVMTDALYVHFSWTGVRTTQRAADLRVFSVITEVIVNAQRTTIAAVEARIAEWLRRCGDRIRAARRGGATRRRRARRPAGDL